MPFLFCAAPFGAAQTAESAAAEPVEPTVELAVELLSEMHLDRDYGFGFCYPKGWQVFTGTPAAHVLVMGKAQNGSTPMVSVVLEPADREILNLPQETFQKRLEAKYREVQIKQFGAITIDDKPCRAIYFQAASGGTTSDFLQVTFLHMGKTFTVTASDTLPNFAENAEVFLEILDSFAFLPDTHPDTTGATMGKDGRPEFTADEKREIEEFLAAFAEQYQEDVKAVNERGETLLHGAALLGLPAVAKFLVWQGADTHAADNLGMTPLHLAASLGHIEVVKQLVAQGADINTKSSGNQSSTPLDMAKSGKNTEAMIAYLESIGAQSGTPTFTAEEQEAEIDRWHANLRYPISFSGDSRTGFGLFLHEAASDGNLTVVKYFISEGADVNVKNNDGKTPLDHARERNHTTVVRLLESVGGKSGSEIRTPAVAAAPVFRSATPAPAAPASQLTAAEQAEIDRFLAEYGRDVKAVDEDGWTLLHRAVMHGYGIATVKYLVAQGADVNAKDKNGLAPLHMVPKMPIGEIAKRVEIAKYLVSAGANPNAKNKWGNIPLDYTREENFTAIVQYFESVSSGGTQVTAAPAPRSAPATTPARPAQAAPPAAPAARPAGPSAEEYDMAASAVVYGYTNDWQRFTRQYRFASDFVNAGNQVIRNPNNRNALRNFARIQEKYTGNSIDVD